MPLSHLHGVRVPATADFHVHLRDGPMMELVVPTIREGGVDLVYVMPNLIPPITTVSQALAYRKALLAIDPNVTYLMTLYLHPSITANFSVSLKPGHIIEAKLAGITGVKSYPAGVTTNSAAGVVNYAMYYPVFAEMERQGMVLNLHGECPSTPAATRSVPLNVSEGVMADSEEREATTILNAEAQFLPTLLDLHMRFPNLRIVLEHCTTAAAVAAVEACGPTVAGTITAHHLHITIDDWAGNPHNYCKPVAKLPSDRAALLQAATSGNPKFFFGSDSAPHPRQAKGGDGTGKVAAGVFTQPYSTQLVLEALDAAVASGIVAEERVTYEVVVGFLSESGRRFYDVESSQERKMYLWQQGGETGQTIRRELRTDMGELAVVPFRAGERTWGLTWEKHATAGIVIL